MSYGIQVRLLTGRYDAAQYTDREQPEWPPHPARLFCALVSAARTERDWAALRWLERQPAPDVHAAPLVESTVRSEYVVTNRLEAKGGSLAHPGRTNQLRTRSSAVPAGPVVRFVWEVEAPAEVEAALSTLAGRVAYFGRSTSVALVAPAGTPSELDGLQVWRAGDVADAELLLRVPVPGYTDRLRDAYEKDLPAWQIGHARGYRVDRPQPAATPVEAPSAYTDFIVMRFSGIRPDGRLTGDFTAALRRAVMSRVADPLPEALHGHGEPGKPHVAFLGLPFVGDEHADGHLLGLAVAVPALPEEERRAIVRGLLSSGDELRLRVPRLGEVSLAYQPGLIRPWGLDPERWRQGSTRWVTATPLVFDRYPKKGRLEEEVVRSLRTAGLPEPVEVEVSAAPMQAGGIRLTPPDLPDKLAGRIFRHVAVTFDRRVHGPVMAGAGRYLGLGLFTPPAAASAGRLAAGVTA